MAQVQRLPSDSNGIYGAVDLGRNAVHPAARALREYVSDNTIDEMAQFVLIDLAWSQPVSAFRKASTRRLA